MGGVVVWSLGRIARQGRDLDGCGKCRAPHPDEARPPHHEGHEGKGQGARPWPTGRVRVGGSALPSPTGCWECRTVFSAATMTPAVRLRRGGLVPQRELLDSVRPKTCGGTSTAGLERCNFVERRKCTRALYQSDIEGRTAFGASPYKESIPVSWPCPCERTRVVRMEAPHA